MPELGTAKDSAGGRAASELAGLLVACQGAKRSVFLFGSEQRDIYRLRDMVVAAFPGLKLAGICDADFDGPASQAIVDHIVKARPDMVIVDMPRRDFRRFERDHASGLPGATLVNLPGAFRRHLRATEPKRRAGRFSLPRFLRPAVEGAGLLRIVLGQALRGAHAQPRQPASPALRRDGLQEPFRKFSPHPEG